MFIQLRNYRPNLAKAENQKIMKYFDTLMKVSILKIWNFKTFDISSVWKYRPHYYNEMRMGVWKQFLKNESDKNEMLLANKRRINSMGETIVNRKDIENKFEERKFEMKITHENNTIDFSAFLFSPPLPTARFLSTFSVLS